jgi:hypothetical protein
MDPIGHAAAQLPELPEPGEPPTLDQGATTGLFIGGVQDKGFAKVRENGMAQFEITFIDESVESTMLYTSAILLQCFAVNETADAFQWTHGIEDPGFIHRNTERTALVTIQAGAGASPMYYSVEIECRAGSPINDVVARFAFTVQLEVYQRFALMPSGPPPRVGPDEPVTLRVEITNNGNDAARYLGSVSAPPGFVFEEPPTVIIQPGESQVVEINGFTPRDKLWFRQQMAPVQVTYGPEDGAAAEQTRTIGVAMGGLYLHPALVPLVLLSLLAVVMLFLLIGYARRTVEEQVLGKPVPPWRIPVEREYLKRLEQEDPDEFYIVRYHLMVEEHQSAMLWYKHFKKATRKDRKLERRWYTRSEKVKGRTSRLRARQERLEGRMARRLRVVPRRRRRRLKALERKLLEKQWSEQRRLLKIHKRSVKKIAKIHGKQEKQAKKAADADFQKELKKAEKENRKRIKEGEDPLPVPQQGEWEYPEPEFPALVETPLVALGESHLALRAERLSRRYNRKIARRTRRAKKKMRRKGAKRDKKAARLKKKIPAPPSTHLYDTDEYLRPDQVVVEDSRPALQRVLLIPSMEARDALRRRRMVYKVKIQQAKQAGDQERVEQLKKEFEEERSRILEVPPRPVKGSAKRKPSEKGQAADPNKPPQEEASSGGMLRALKRRRGAEGDDTSDPEVPQGESAADAANQASKGKGPVEESGDS